MRSPPSVRNQRRSRGLGSLCQQASKLSVRNSSAHCLPFLVVPAVKAARRAFKPHEKKHSRGYSAAIIHMFQASDLLASPSFHTPSSQISVKSLAALHNRQTTSIVSAFQVLS
jgi:hypothetical protein